MPTKKTEVDVAALQAEVVALRKELAALKREVSKRPSGGGADPRVDKLLELFEASNQLRFIARQME